MTCTRLAKKPRLARSVAKDDISGLWKTGVDVICVQAACAGTADRFATVSAAQVEAILRPIQSASPG